MIINLINHIITINMIYIKIIKINTLQILIQIIKMISLYLHIKFIYFSIIGIIIIDVIIYQ